MNRVGIIAADPPLSFRRFRRFKYLKEEASKAEEKS